jgi:hypothetical protein
VGAIANGNVNQDVQDVRAELAWLKSIAPALPQAPLNSFERGRIDGSPRQKATPRILRDQVMDAVRHRAVGGPREVEARIEALLADEEDANTARDLPNDVGDPRGAIFSMRCGAISTAAGKVQSWNRKYPAS